MGEKLQFVKNNLFWITPIGITVLTALGYVLAYFMEMGFCDEFKIPTNLIKVELSQVIYATLQVTMVLSLTLIIGYTLFIKPFQEKAPKVLRMSFNLSASLFLVVLLYFLLYRNMWQEWIQPLIGFLVVSIISIIYESRYVIWNKLKSLTHISKTASTPSLKQVKEKSQVKKDKHVETKQDLDWRNVTFFTIAIVIILLFISYSIGEANAKKQEEFFTINNPQYSAVLRVYGDRAICQTLDKNDSSDNQTIEYILKGNIFIVNASEHTLTLENTGRLIK